MTEANLDHQPSWPFYQSHEQVYCLYCSAKVCAQFQKKAVIHSVAEFNKVCTQFEKKATVLR